MVPWTTNEGAPVDAVSAVVELVVDSGVGSDRAGVLTDGGVVVELPMLELDPLEPQPANVKAHRAASAAALCRVIPNRAWLVIIVPHPLFFALFFEFLSETHAVAKFNLDNATRRRSKQKTGERSTAMKVSQHSTVERPWTIRSFGTLGLWIGTFHPSP